MGSLIPPPKHTAILLLWFSQHDAGFRFDEHRIFDVFMKMKLYIKWTQSQMSIASGGLKVLVLVIL